MDELRRIRDSVSMSLGDEFLSADDPQGLSGLDEDADTEPVIPGVNLAELDAFVAKVRQAHERYSTSMDAALTVGLHKCLPVSRRLASDRRMWAWLGIIRYPSFVASRWAKSAGRDGVERRNQFRFHGDPVRQTFARLWWAAELTKGEHDDYSLTEKLLGLERFQDGYEAMFGRAFCQYRPALEAFINLVGPQSQRTIREVSKEFGYITTTLVLEALGPAEIESLLSELIVLVERKAA